MNMSADFYISIDYEKGSTSPSRVFRVATDLIESFQEIDNYLIKSISSKIEPVILLEDIETGSVKIWLKNVLQSADDEGLKNLDWKPLVGKYLVKSKYFIIDFLENRTEITNKAQVQELNSKLLKTAEETEVKQIPLYRGMSNKDLLNGIQKITEALKPLNEDDRVEFITSDEKATFNLAFKCAPEKIEDLLTERTLRITGEMIYKVKKPDYLGESMWEVRYNQRNFSVKVMDGGLA